MHTNGLTKRLVLLGLSALGLYAIIGSLGTGYAPAATTAPPTGSPPGGPFVTVVNTTANPVPVVQQGAVTLSGTPNVNVANTAASPALVRVVGTTTQPVVVTKYAGPALAGLSALLYTVPAGKTLVVEYVSAWVTVGAGGKVYIGQLYNGNTASPLSGQVFLIPTFTASADFGASDQVDQYVISQPLKYFVAGGDSITFSSHLDDGTTSGSSATCTITGYLVDAP